MDKNKACPFCGGIFEYDNYDASFSEWWKCDTCGAQVNDSDYLNARPAEDALRAQLAARDAEIARLREVIEAVEWGYDSYCPWCGYPEAGKSHAPDCPRQLALASDVTDNVTDGEDGK